MAAPPPDKAAFDWFTAVPWAVALTGTAVSLVWNFVNYRMTTGLQRRIRRETIALEEFRRIRVSIDAATGELANQRAALASLSGSAVGLDEWRTQVGEAQKTVVETYQRLSSALERANKSSFAKGEDWLRLVDPIWDDFSTVIDGAYNPTRREAEVRSVPAKAADKIGELVMTVEARLDRELQDYALGK